VSIPTNLKYANSHEWAHLAGDGLVTVGITDHAQEALGDVVVLDPPRVGRKVAAGEACAVVESVKAASDIHAPVSGEIVAFNEKAVSAPESLNQDAYGTWLFKIRPDNPTDLDRLLDATAYQSVAESDER